MDQQKSKHFIEKPVVALAMLLAATACGVAAEGTTDETPLAEVPAAIINGDPVTDPDVNVMLAYHGTSACSGTLLNERWVVTAKHCLGVGSYINRLVRGSDIRGLARIVLHPSRDVALVEADSPFPNVWPVSMYPWDPVRLVGQAVTCYGYGASATDGSGRGSLRQGAMRVSSVNREFEVVPADERNQISYSGDSGGGCFLNSKARALLGVHSYSTIQLRTAAYVPTAHFSQWALPIIADPTQRLICHGRECITNPRPLPHNVNQEVAWRPCPGQLTGPGGYSFDYDITYDMEQGFDKVLLAGEFLTGSGTRLGTSTASHLGHRVGLYTDYSVQSNGISWLRALCPNDP